MLHVKDIAVSKYPDRLIYIAGYDTELDLTGGEVTFSFSNGSPIVNAMDFTVVSIRHEIDFNTPGVYVVETRFKNSDIMATFAIQVVDKDYIDNIIGSTSK